MGGVFKYFDLHATLKCLLMYSTSSFGWIVYEVYAVKPTRSTFQTGNLACGICWEF